MVRRTPTHAGPRWLRLTSVVLVSLPLAAHDREDVGVSGRGARGWRTRASTANLRARKSCLCRRVPSRRGSASWTAMSAATMVRLASVMDARQSSKLQDEVRLLGEALKQAVDARANNIRAFPQPLFHDPQSLLMSSGCAGCCTRPCEGRGPGSTPGEDAG